ncbi:MAG: phage tail sheath family protein [Clostridia bacterium]|nr:phage tail sheath family protein [Clostridia bacterium]
MALGGGVFLAQNKTLPGAYINFVSVLNAGADISERGRATLPLSLDWGEEEKMFTVEAADFIKDSLKIFGYEYTHEKLKAVREIFKNAGTVHFFRLNSGGEKAENTFARAKHTGVLGNSLSIVIKENAESAAGAELYDVSTYLGTLCVDVQKGVGSAAALASNDFVEWKAGAALSLTAGTPLSGGVNGAVTGAAYQSYLDAAESVSFNAMGCTSDVAEIKDMFCAYTRRMRDEAGKKFQCVLYDEAADFEGVISVRNTANDSDEAGALVPWVTGLAAGCAVNRSADNMRYDGEYDVDTAYTQAELSAGIEAGAFMFHLSDGEARVLRDINTFVSATDEKSRDFSDNQVMRVLDQTANDIAAVFAKKYLGRVANDESGRISFWNDIVKHHAELEKIRAIEGFDSGDVRVEQGETKRAVSVFDKIKPVCAMSQLYMTVYVM